MIKNFANSEVTIFTLFVVIFKRTRPDIRPSVADGWEGADIRLVLTDGRTDGQTDQWTDRRTDKASYRVACPQLKREEISPRVKVKEIKGKEIRQQFFFFARK